MTVDPGQRVNAVPGLISVFLLIGMRYEHECENLEQVVEQTWNRTPENSIENRTIGDS